MIMDLRIQIQQLDAQLRSSKQENQLLRINCQILGTVLAKTRNDILQVIQQLDNPQVLKEVIQTNLEGSLEYKPENVANTIIQQGIALMQLRALVAQQQKTIEDHDNKPKN